MKNYRNILIAALLFFVAAPVFGQATFDEDVTDVPVDGGIVTVTLMAAAYGIKKYKERNEEV